jgi:DNA-directed RNA polymerase specialized sigma24 family protein
MSDPGSVTVWLDRLKAGEGRDEAVARLWERYFERLAASARQHLQSRARATDGEDVALSVFDSFVRAAGAGRFPRLDDRNDLWQLLLRLTGRKAANVLRDEGRQKRGGGRVIHGLANGSDSSGACDLAITSADPDPAEAAALAEEVEHLLAALPSDDLRRVAVWALEGYTNREIATKLGRAVATAERKLRLIRESWSARTPT